MIESAYVRVIEGGCGLFLPHQTLFRALIASHFGSQEVDCHFPAQPLRFGQKGSPSANSIVGKSCHTGLKTFDAKVIYPSGG
jgi:hypothetical protein